MKLAALRYDQNCVILKERALPVRLFLRLTVDVFDHGSTVCVSQKCIEPGLPRNAVKS